MGDPIKLLFLEKAIELVEKDQLAQKAVQTGEYLLEGLRNIEKLQGGILNASRGRGIFCAVNVDGKGLRDKINNNLLQQGKGLYFCFCGGLFLWRAIWTVVLKNNEYFWFFKPVLAWFTFHAPLRVPMWN